ncbi:Transmembrane emp24 domain-containing protein 10 [Zea mays]|uniref:Transmembrane emp24 domain-containing protein 10 n=1 Tax=Zea mays TaxID=4577 RepID=A0A1D6ERA7_MAIZE|nr:Transmembrane emp24 domain-containing protein 10 [Zea mays]
MVVVVDKSIAIHFIENILVTSPFGDIVHKKEKVSMGQFAFTTAEAGNYLACFSIDGEDRGLVVKLNLDWKIGLASRDWDSVAKKEKIEGVELELLKLEVAVQSIHDNLLLLKSKEANMRDVSEQTNSRVTWLSMLSLVVCIAVSVLQLWHLQQYFRKMKLI